jgi:hypothetical protein
MSYAYLLELQPYDPVGAVTRNLYFSSGLVNNIVPGTSNPYPVRLVRDFGDDTAIFNDNLPSEPSLSVGNISINNQDGKYDFLLDYLWGNRPLVLKRGIPGTDYSNYTTIFSGVTIEAFSDQRTITLTLKDASHKLLKPIQENKFAGTGGAEGTANLKDVRKPLLFGSALNLTPILLDQSKLIYQICDGACSVQAAWDIGNSLTFQSNVVNYAALDSLSVTPGSYATCTSLGLIKLGATPVEGLTVDATSTVVPSGTASSIIQAVLALKGITSGELEAATFSEFASDLPSSVSGLYYSDPEFELAEWLSNFVSSCGGFWYITPAGKFAVSLFKFRTPTKQVSEKDLFSLQKISSPKPIWRVVTEHSRNLTVQGLSDPAIRLFASKTSFTFLDNLAENPTDSITVTALLYNVPEPVTFSASPSVTLSGTGNSRTISVVDFAANRQVVITASSGGITDRITLTRLDRSTAASGATVNEESGNLIPAPFSLSQTTFTNGASLATVDGIARAALTGAAFSTAIFSGFQPVVPGETLWFSYYAYCDISTSDGIRGGYTWRNAAGVETSVDLPLTALVGSEAVGSVNLRYRFQSIQVPATAVGIRFYVVRPTWSPSPGGTFFVHRPAITRVQPGAAITSPGNSNRVPFSLMERDLGWNVVWEGTPALTIVSRQYGTFEGRRFFQGTATATSGGSAFSVGNDLPDDPTTGVGAAFRVQPGEILSVQCRVGFGNTAASGGSYLLRIWFSKADGSTTDVILFSGTDIRTISAGVLSSFVTVPSDYIYGRLELYAVAGTSGNLDIAISEPMVTTASSGQTTHPIFTPGPNSINGADVTADVVPSLASLSGTVFQADHLGVISAGQLPRTIQATRKRGNTDVSSSTSWSVSTSNCTASISSSGLISITAVTGTGQIEVISTRDGVVLTTSFDVVVQRAAPPSSGGGGGGTSANTSSFNVIPGGLVWTDATGDLTVTTGSGGQVSLAAPLEFFPNTSHPSFGFFDFNCFLRWRRESSPGVWEVVGADASATELAYVEMDNGNMVWSSNGTITCNRTATGLGASTSQKFRLQARGDVSNYLFGTASATGS